MTYNYKVERTICNHIVINVVEPDKNNGPVASDTDTGAKIGV